MRSPPMLLTKTPCLNHNTKHNMSSTRTRTEVRNAANESIVEMLEEQLLEASTNYRHTLRRALRAIRVYPEPILTRRQALDISGVGNHIARQIQIHLLERSSSQSAMPEPGAVLLPDEPDTPLPPRRRPHASRAGPRRKEYVPRYRTAPYGILIALYHAESSGNPAMRKDDLARSAQQYCDNPVLTQSSDDPFTWYDGWSSVNKTLVSKGLVVRAGRPIKFSLSATGRQLAERLIDVNNDVLAMGAREYRPDGAPVDVGVGNLPLARRTSAGASARDRARLSASHSLSDSSEDPPQFVSQEEADLQMAQELARQFDEEDTAARQGKSPIKEAGRATNRPVLKPVVDTETASALERKYRNGREFGVVGPGIPPSTTQHSRSTPQTRRRKLTAAQCDRATRAIQRLEAGGYDRSDCIKIVDILHAEKALPRNADGVYQAVVKALWEAEKQDRRLGRSPEPIGLRISELASDDDDDDNVIGYQKELEDSARSRETLELDKPVEPVRVPSDPVLRASSVDRVARTPEMRPTSKKRSNDPVVVIDLDEDSILDPGSSKASKTQHQPHTLKPVKRPRVTDVISIDSGDEGGVDTNNIRTSVSPTQQVLKRAPVREGLSSQEHEPHESGNDGVRQSNGDSDISPLEGIHVHDPSLAEEGGLQTGDISIAQNDVPAQSEECRIVLLLDSMERFRNSNTMAGHVKSPGELLLEEGVDCEVRQLPTGDALFIAQFQDESEVVLDYIIERKTIEDYGASMKDGRVARQSYLMRHANIKRQVFLLEGTLNDKEDLYNKTELHKKLAEMTMCSGLYVKHTRDIQDTMHFYASLFRRLRRKFLKQSKSMTLRDRSLFSEWNDRVNTMKKSLTLQQLFMIQFCHIPGIGTTKAQAIMQMGYTTPFLLYTAYKHLNTQEERDEMLNKGAHAIGSTSSKAVSQLFNQREYPTIADKDHVIPFTFS